MMMPRVTVQAVAHRIRGKATFDAVAAGLNEGYALFEARRRPDAAGIELGPGKRVEFNDDSCTGCATCA